MKIHPTVDFTKTLLASLSYAASSKRIYFIFKSLLHSKETEMYDSHIQAFK